MRIHARVQRFGILTTDQSLWNRRFPYWVPNRGPSGDGSWPSRLEPSPTTTWLSPLRLRAPHGEQERKIGGEEDRPRRGDTYEKKERGLVFPSPRKIFLGIILSLITHRNIDREQDRRFFAEKTPMVRSVCPLAFAFSQPSSFFPFI